VSLQDCGSFFFNSLRDTAIIKFSFIQNILDAVSLQDCGSFFFNSRRDTASGQFSLGKNISDAVSLQDCGSFFFGFAAPGHGNHQIFIYTEYF
ncbi:hypothetical protein, partial [Microseira sp. BLCC-F43]|uniref:hypothetical protein n=1 Tax=Microseira sp. BLCC-F43 TaxID=3153602 RepID=UPI0035BB261E